MAKNIFSPQRLRANTLKRHRPARLLVLAAGLLLGECLATGHAATVSQRASSERKLDAGCVCDTACPCGKKSEPPWHGVFMPRKANLPPIYWYDKINPVWWFGNIDDPVPPAWYEPGNPQRTMKWHCRNPFANLSHYVIGVADKDTTRYGHYPDQIGNPRGGWNFAVARSRLLLLPFWDYKNRRMEFYFGWRERGDFGMKLVFHRVPEPQKS